MSDYIDTREGWREIPVSEHVGQRALLVERDPDGKVTRSWVREEPVPPLPTEPYTVIRVTWRDSADARCVYTRNETDRWGPYEADYLAQNITGYEVLAEPVSPDLADLEEALRQASKELDRVRRKTAKAVRDEFEAADWDTSAGTVTAIFREFGVEA